MMRRLALILGCVAVMSLTFVATLYVLNLIMIAVQGDTSKESVLEDLPPFHPSHSGRPRWHSIQHVHVQKTPEGSAVAGEPVFRLTSIFALRPPSIALVFEDLPSDPVVRVAARVKLVSEPRIWIELREPDSSETGVVDINLIDRQIKTLSGNVRRSGIVSDADGWLSVWIEYPIKSNRIIARIVFAGPQQPSQLLLGGVTAE